MQPDWLKRTELLIKKEGIKKLQGAHVLIAGLGGVGSWAAEFICRAGVGHLSIVDHDMVKASNRNRQLCALKSTEGMYKSDVLAQRLKDINPQMRLNAYSLFLKDEKTPQLISQLKPDYIIDAIDTLSPKVFLIHHAVIQNIPIISSLGAGGKLDPSKIKVSDISKSSHCRLAFYIRKRLRKLGIEKGFKVVFSTENVSDDAIILVADESNKKSTVGTISYIPAMFGAFCAAEVVNDILKETSS